MLNHDIFCRQNESTEQSGKRKDSNAQRMRNTRKSLKHSSKRSMALKKQQYLDINNDEILAEETQLDHDYWILVADLQLNIFNIHITCYLVIGC